MSFMRLDRLARWETGALLLLLVHGFGAPRSAWAGCNHLVLSRSDLLLAFNQLDVLIAGDSSGLSSDDLATDPLGQQGPKRPTPCSGLSCSNRVPLPVPMAFPGSHRVDQWGVLSTVDLLSITSLHGRTVDEP